MVTHGTIWTLFFLLIVVAYVTVCFISMPSSGFNIMTGYLYYSLAFTCMKDIYLVGILFLILGSFALFKAALTAEQNLGYTFIACLVWSLTLALPIFLTMTGYVPYCWGKHA